MHVCNDPRHAIAVHEGAESRHARVWQANHVHACISFGHSAMDGFNTHYGHVMAGHDEGPRERLREAADPTARLRRIFVTKETDVHGRCIALTPRKNETTSDGDQASLRS